MPPVTNTAPQPGVTDSTDNSTSIDNPENWNFLDPDEEDNEGKPKPGTEQEEPVGEEQEAPETETDEQQEAEQDENSEEEEPDDKKGKSPSLTDDVLVTIKGGEQVSLAELRDGYMRQSHFTRERQKDAQRASHIQRVTEKVQAFLQAQIPPPPHPSMAYSAPQQYQALMAQHDASVRAWQHATELGEEAKEQSESFMTDEQQQALDEQRALMIEKFPVLATKQGRDDFVKEVSALTSRAGYSEEEVRGLGDYRAITVLRYAAKGLAAEIAAAKAKAKLKGKDIPPVNPAAPVKRQAPQNAQGQKSKEAMQKLARSGSIHDAMNVDFE